MTTQPAGQQPREPPDTSPLGRNFWRLLFSSGLSNLADGVIKIALPLVAVSYTRSPALIAGLSLAFTLPWLLCALPAGVLVDRVNRRTAMTVANVVRAGILGTLVTFAALDGASIALLYVAAFCIGTAETVYDTAAQAFLPQLVSRPQLPRANGRLYAVELSTNQFVGPPLAGILAASGAVLAFATPAALWLVAVGLIILIRGNFRPERIEKTTWRADLVGGLKFVWREPLLRRFAIVVGGFNLASNAAFAVFVLFAVGPGSAMGLTEPAYGILLTATAVGGLIGSLIAPRVVALVGRARSVTVSFALSAGLLAVPGITTNVWVIGVMFAVGSAAILVSNIVLVSMRQHITPDRLLGRVTSAYRLVAWGTMPIGAAIGGLIAEVAGLPAVFLMAGTLAVLMAALTLPVTDAQMTEAENRAD